jgi:hypothetical protein
VVGGSCAFINIDPEAIGNWAEKRNLPYSGYSDLAEKEEVYELVRECVERVLDAPTSVADHRLPMADVDVIDRPPQQRLE